LAHPVDIVVDNRIIDQRELGFRTTAINSLDISRSSWIVIQWPSGTVITRLEARNVTMVKMEIILFFIGMLIVLPG
jgi:hypothetical protein